MADPVTNNIALVLPTQGGDLNTWGTVLNDGVISAIDAYLCAPLAISITSSDVAITPTQFAGSSAFILSGVLTGNRNLTIPLSPNSLTVASAGKFLVVNNTTGAFNVTVKTVASGSTGVTVPQGGALLLYSDGTNVVYCNNGLAALIQIVAGDPNGQLAGQAGSVNKNASMAYDQTNNAFYVCTTTGTASTAVWTSPTITVLRGFDQPINLWINVTVSANSLTVAFKAANTSADATALNPITVLFRDYRPAEGNPSQAQITGPLSITAPTGATLGSTSGVPFRFWIVLFNNSGTIFPGLINCSGNGRLYSLMESNLVSPSAIGAGSTSLGTFYSTSSLSNVPFRIVGFLTYETALVTAGTYNNAPDVVQLFGAGVKKPGDLIQTVSGSTTTPGANNSGVMAPLSVPFSQSITMVSKANLVRVVIMSTMNTSSGAGCATQIARGSTLIGLPQGIQNGAASTGTAPVSFNILDKPGVATPGYQLYGQVNAGFVTVPSGAVTGLGTYTQLEELMG